MKCPFISPKTKSKKKKGFCTYWEEKEPDCANCRFDGRFIAAGVEKHRYKVAKDKLRRRKAI